MELLHALDVKSGCRLCLRVGNDLTPIFQSQEQDPNDSMSLPARIMACVGYEIVKDERLPSRICPSCIQEVDRWVVFRSQAQCTNTLLTKVYVEGYQIALPIVVCQDTKQDSSGKKSATFVVIGDPKSEVDIPNKCPTISEKQDSSNLDSRTSVAKPIVSNSPKSDTILQSVLKSAGLDPEIPADDVDNSGEDRHCERASHTDSDGDAGILSADDDDTDNDDVLDVEGQNQDGDDISWRLKPVKCPVCDKSYRKHSGVKVHLRINHTILKYYPCVICGHVSLLSSGRLKHLAKKHKEYLSKKNTCNVCGFHFKNLKSYSRHMKAHEDSRRCKFCELLLETVEALEKHKKTVHRQELSEEPPPDVDSNYHCHRCENVSFWKKEDWKNHYIDVHRTEEVYPCSLCQKAFRTQRQRENHVRSHTGEKPFMCEHCATRYTTKESLNHHMRKHTGQFQCKQCQKIYTSYSGLYHHKRTHTNTTPYICHECGKTFKSATGVQFHMRLHSGEKPFKCDLCDFTCRQYPGLYAHKVKHSDERPFKCDQCDKTFKMKAWLKIHKKTHSGIKNYVCDICNHAFIAMYQLRSHMKTHSGEKPHVCDICFKTFARRDTLTEHVRIHTKETKYTCKQCNEQFMFLKPFKRHKCSGN